MPIKVWRVDLDFSLSSRDLEVLSFQEQARANRLIAPTLRARFQAAHVAKRLILSRIIGIPPADLQFSTGKFGKPELVNLDPGVIEFNLAHSGDIMLLAVRPGGAVGVDVEEVKTNIDVSGLAALTCSSEEMALMNSRPDVNRIDAFYKLWTAKEAILKACGIGIQGGLQKVRIAVNQKQNGYGEFLESHYQWWTIDLAPNFIAALAAPQSTATDWDGCLTTWPD